MHFNFTIKDGIRTGLLQTRAGEVQTPTFMPDATRGAIKGLVPEDVARTGIEVVLSNTYHLHLQPGEDVIAKLGGLHEFSKWQGPILTDSGGFQVFSLAKIRKITEDGVTFKDPKTGNMVVLTPEKSIQIQMKLGADMLVAFDDVTALDDKGRSRTKEAFERTHRWLERSLAEFQRLTKDMKPTDRPLLFGVVQGGLDKELRKQSLEIVQSLPVDGIAIGGLAVGESRAEMHEILRFLAPLYDPNRPHFLLGVGDPTDLRYAIEQGIDMLDCVLPTRNARHGTAWVRASNSAHFESFSSGARRGMLDTANSAPRKKIQTGLEYDARTILDEKIHLTNAKYTTDKKPLDPTCDCATCVAGYSRGYLRHQFKVGESLAGSLVSVHNLRYLQRICEEYRK